MQIGKVRLSLECSLIEWTYSVKHMPLWFSFSLLQPESSIHMSVFYNRQAVPADSILYILPAKNKKIAPEQQIAATLNCTTAALTLCQISCPRVASNWTIRLMHHCMFLALTYQVVTWLLSLEIQGCSWHRPLLYVPAVFSRWAINLFLVSPKRQ